MISRIVCLCFVLMLSGSFSVAALPSENMLANPGFEAGDKFPSGWTLNPDQKLFSIDKTVSHSGNASLLWQSGGTDSPYVLLNQPVKLQTGRLYQFTAWLKTENLIGAQSPGATVGIDFQDKDGKSVYGGPYPGGLKGTRGWWKLTSYAQVFTNVVGGNFVCYVRKQGGKDKKTFTGKAWWDDISLRPVTCQIRMLKPSYKRILFDGDEKISLEVETWPEDYDLTFKDVKLVVVISEAETKKPVLTKSFDLTKRQEIVSFSIDKLKHGKYEVSTALVAKSDSQILWQPYKYSIYRKPTTAKPKIHFDKHHRCIVDGKPFFPLGVYIRTAKWTGVCKYEETLKNLSDSKFNCFINYDKMTNKQMDQAHEAGLKVIYSVIRFYNYLWWSGIPSANDEVRLLKKPIMRLRNHPALLAWYTMDEAGVAHMPQHLAHYEALNEFDPNHPAWMLHNKTCEETVLFDACDVMGTDSYPAPIKPISEVGKATRESFAATRNSRPVWIVPEIMEYRLSKYKDMGTNNRALTLEEMRCSAWQALCEGANGLVFYSYHTMFQDGKLLSQWEGVKQMASEIAEYIPVLLSIEPVPEIIVDGSDKLNWIAKRKGDTLYIFTVNNSREQLKNVKFKVAELKSEITITVDSLSDRQKTISVKQEQWKDTFKALEVKIYKISAES